MRNTFLLLSFLFVGCVGAIAQNKTLGVGTAAPNPNAALHVESPTNNQGFIMPRLTKTQRLAMTLTPSDMGLMVYDITDTSVYTWDGLVWAEAGRLSWPYVDTVTSAPAGSNLLRILYTGAGNVGIAQFSNLSPTNNFQPLFVTNAGTNGAGYFQVTNTASASPGLRSLTNTNQAGAHAFLGRTTGTGASAGYFEIVNAANQNAALYATTNGSGGANSAAIVGETATAFSAIIGRATGGAANGVSGISTDPGAGSYAILGTVSATGGGQAGVFNISNTANANNTLEATTNGTGGAGLFKVQNAASTKPALWAETNSNQALSAPIFGLNTGTGDVAASFKINNAGNTFPAVYAETNGTNGTGARFRKLGTGGGYGLYIDTFGGTGTQVDNKTTGNGYAGVFQNIQATNTFAALFAESVGSGPSMWANKMDAEVGPAIAATNSSTGGGSAGIFEITNASNTAAAIDASTTGSGAAVMAKNEGTGNGFAGLFQNTNATNTYPGVQIEVAATSGNAMYINKSGNGGNFVTYAISGTPAARIDNTGKGFFNSGTQNSGADVAELFDVEGDRSQYEPGDVLVISESTDRTVEKSTSPVSTKIAGVYATKPGVVLTERESEANTDDLVPMGVVGVIPTKVCLENGPIKRGDLLVTSSTKGHAMKAKPVVINGVEIYPTGAILGKALENFESGNTGLIKVLVNVK